jgi:hypothetical protein
MAIAGREKRYRVVATSRAQSEISLWQRFRPSENAV